jgi:hypothetical protein
LLEKKLASFTIPAQNANLTASLEAIQGRFDKEMECQVNSPTIEPPTQKPSTLR